MDNTFMKKCIRLCSLTLIVAQVTLLDPGFAFAKAGPKLNKTRVTIKVGKTLKLKVTGAGKQKIKWTSSNKKAATVTQKGIVKGIKPGSSVIEAKTGNLRLRCKVKIVKTSKKTVYYYRKKLAEYIFQNGQKNDLGNYEISYFKPDSVDSKSISISYDAENSELILYSMYYHRDEDGDKYSGSMTLYVPLDNNDCTADYIFVNNPGSDEESHERAYVGDIALSKIKKEDNNFVWITEEGSDPLSEEDSSLSEQANLYMTIAYLDYQLILLKRGNGCTVRNLGFGE